MEKLKFTVLLEKSIVRTKKILLNPFSFKKWMALFLIAYLAGALSGGINFNYTGGGKDFFNPLDNNIELENNPEDTVQEDIIVENEPEQASEFKFIIEFFSDKDISAKELFSMISNLAVFKQVKPFLMLIGIIMLFSFGLIILFTWLYSRFLFVWFNAVVNDSIAIKEPFNRYKKQGESIFKVSIFMMFLNMLLSGIFLYWVVGISRTSGVFFEFRMNKFNELFEVFKLPFFSMIAYFAAAGLLNFFLTKFVVVFMAIKQTTFWPGIKELIRVFKENAKDMVLFVFVYFFLSIASAIIYMIVLLVSFLVIGLGGALIFGVLYFLTVFLLKIKMLFAILAVILGLCFALLAVLFISALGLPFAVFFKNFLLYFISNLNCGYTPIPLEKQRIANRE